MNDPIASRTDSQKDAATLEREIDQTRAQMDQTLGALERKFSPGEFLDQTLNLVRQHGGGLATNVGSIIKENPMPALVTAAGIVWMVVSSNQPKTSFRARTVGYEYDPPEDEYVRADDEYAGAEVKSQNAESGVLAQAGQRLKSGAAATRQKLTASREAVSSGFGIVSSGVSKTAETAQEQAMRVRQGVNNLREGVNSLLDEQPLVLGALGIALGAAIGAALPITEEEDRLLGTARDRTMAKIKETGSESLNQVTGSVTRMAEEAKENISQTLGRASENEPNPGARRVPDKVPGITKLP